MKGKVDEKRCPLCGEENHCGAHKKERCWCRDEKVPLDLRELIPTEDRMKACICRDCVIRFKNDEAGYRQWLTSFRVSAWKKAKDFPCSKAVGRNRQ